MSAVFVSTFSGSALVASLPFTLAAVVLVLAVAFVVALRVGKHALVDVAWGLGFVAIALTSYVASSLSDADADPARRLLVTVLTVVWGLRLAVHIGLRSRGHGEDPRYEELLTKAKGNPALFMLTRVYLTQGVMMWFISLPVQVTAFETPSLGVLAWVGAGIWLIGFLFETIGDRQLQKFRDDPANKGEVLDTGLWHYTRHPNYFGDACAWWGISLIAFSAWPGLLTILSPLLMTWLLAKGTGKPLLEKSMSNRRPGYEDYVRRTSGFVPLPPKRSTKRRA